MCRLKFDERFYALRYGLQRWVSSPSTEIADDLLQARVGVEQRWQTKRGPPGRERIVDWMVLDVEGIYFPDANRDNFGQEFGLIDYDYRWHIGDRFSILSDGFADFFGDGLRTVSVGALMSRPQVGSLYVGYRTVDGPFNSNILQHGIHLPNERKVGSLAPRRRSTWELPATSVNRFP